MSDFDKYWMTIALKEATKGIGKTSPNPVVGAVVVKNNRLISKGYHHSAGADHAEIEALKEAGKEAEGAKLYVTLEPCSHYGKTPPCTLSIIRQKIKTVIIAAGDPNPIAAGGIDRLRDANIEIKTGVCEEEAKKINELFFTCVTKRRPFILMKAAITLDGQLAGRRGGGSITGNIAKRYVKRLRTRYDSILVGVDTAIKDNPTLLPYKKNGNFYRIILDAELKLGYPKLLENPKGLIIFCGYNADISRLDKLPKRIIVKQVQNNSGMLDIRQIVKYIYNMSIMSIMVEGGSAIHKSFLKENLYDKAIVFIAPKLLGGKGIPLFYGDGVNYLKDAVKLKKTQFSPIGEDIVVKGYF